MSAQVLVRTLQPDHGTEPNGTKSRSLVTSWSRTRRHDPTRAAQVVLLGLRHIGSARAYDRFVSCGWIAWRASTTTTSTRPITAVVGYAVSPLLAVKIEMLVKPPGISIPARCRRSLVLQFGQRRVRDLGGSRGSVPIGGAPKHRVQRQRWLRRSPRSRAAGHICSPDGNSGMKVEFRPSRTLRGERVSPRPQTQIRQRPVSDHPYGAPGAAAGRTCAVDDTRYEPPTLHLGSCSSSCAGDLVLQSYVAVCG